MCFPEGCDSSSSILQSFRRFFQKKPKPCASMMRKELCHLRQQANRQRWICWESDAAGLEVEVAMLSGRSWKFIIGNTAKGAEVKERLAELSGIHETELSLVCSGRQIRDDEVLLDTFFTELAGPPPQLQLLRIFRPFALTCSTAAYSEHMQICQQAQGFHQVSPVHIASTSLGSGIRTQAHS
ncbi:HET-E1 [Symbiodinium natans]|uniref:HET-E1 protein n=1 Tax=Symbiodinium natans TaxID=878477 RepID=A0A812PA87_9DINO|nr:HET-E1 [Symbiodinium natans]